jgi:phage-related protein
MINRYAGEIHINPVRILRNDDFNNDGQIKNINGTIELAIELNHQIGIRLQMILGWLKKGSSSSAQFHFAEGGYISVRGLSDTELKELAAKGMIELFDFATDKHWVKKHGQHFGLIWENGRAVDIS